MQADSRPRSPACERNREPILAVLRECFSDCRKVLEIGSGTGEHAVHFAAALPQLSWQTSDRSAYLPGIRAWLDAAGLSNIPLPLQLDVTGQWPDERYDAVFTANTLHIMAWHEVECLFEGVCRVTVDDARLAIYGPFRYGGRHTSESNAAFDASLRRRAPHMGVRDFEAVAALAQRAGFSLLDDRAMPANNRCLVWRKGDRHGG